MNLHSRVDRLEALHRRPSSELSAAERAEVDQQVQMLRHLAPGAENRHDALHELLRDLERGTRTDEDLARMAGVNLDVLRVVARLEASY